MSDTVYYKTEEEIALIRKSSLLVSETIAAVAAAIRPGVRTGELDQLAEDFIHDHGAIPAFKGYQGFPSTLCVSVNDQVVHGIPGDRELREGDLVSVDCGVVWNGFYGDSAYTFALQGADPGHLELMHVTHEALYRGIKAAVAGNRLGDIGFAVQDFAEREKGHGVVRELVGHGIGRELHESPEVPNFGRRGKGMKLLEGLVIAIEPMINLGSKHVLVLDDGWTVCTQDGKVSAHFEHTVVVRKSQAQILSSFEPIEEVVKTNPDLQDFR